MSFKDDDQVSKSFLLAAEIRKWLFGIAIGFGSLILFFAIDWPSREDESRLTDVDSELKSRQAETESIQTRLKQLELQLSDVESERRTSQATIAAREAAKGGKPVLMINPIVEQTSSVLDVREIRVEAEIINASMVDVQIDSIGVEVFEATPSYEMKEALDVTQQMANFRFLYRILPRSPAPIDMPDSEKTQWEDLQRRHGDTDCTHGKLFAISDTSRDVIWKKLEDSTHLRNRNLLLHPDQTTPERFVFVLTEYPEQYHRQWLKFAIVVNLRSPESKQAETRRFEHVVSGLPLPKPSDFTPVVQNTVSQQTTIYRWEPPSPVLLGPASTTPE